MNSWKPILIIVLVLVGIVGLGTFLQSENSGAKSALYYRSPMHPWVTADRPGQCTVCGMDLVPVYSDRSVSNQESGQINRPFSDAKLVGPKKRDLLRTIVVSGEIVPNRLKTRIIAAEVSGRVERVFIESPGTEVKQGDRLYSIYSPVLKEAERDFHLLYQQSQMNHSSKITAEHARLLKAMRLRLKEFGLTSQQIESLPQKQDNISTVDILSPVDGIVTQLKISDGTRVSKGTELMTMDDLYHLWFEFDVYEDDLKDVQVGAQVSIKTGGTTTLSKISFINNTINPVTRSSDARVELRNPAVRKNGLKVRTFSLGEFGEGRIELKAEGRLALPREAFLNAGERFVVFVREGEGFQRRHVKIGFRGDHAWEVTDGISESDEVVLQGNLLLESESRL